jgi:hypothetical protein
MIVKNLIRKVLTKGRARTPTDAKQVPQWAVLAVGKYKKVYPAHYEHYLQLFRRFGMEFSTTDDFESACLRIEEHLKEMKELPLALSTS